MTISIQKVTLFQVLVARKDTRAHPVSTQNGTIIELIAAQVTVAIIEVSAPMVCANP